MSVVGADLQLDEGYGYGTYETGSQDQSAIAWYYIFVECKVEESPASTGTMSWTLEIDTSLDDIAWDGYQLFQEGEFHCRYYRLRIKVWGDPATAQRPKVTRFEDDPRRMDVVPTPAAITSALNQPAGTETRGKRHRVGAGAGDWAGKDDYLVECMDATTPSWRFTPPVKGMRVWNDGTDQVEIYDEAGEWVPYDARKVAPFRQTMMAQGYEAVNGLWGYAIDGLQDSNGYITNAAGDANQDHVDYNIGLLMGDYDLRLCTTTGANHGICKVYIDPPATVGTTLVATFDLFAGAANNVIQTQAAITIAAAGTKTVRLKVDGKNIGSGGHELEISWVEIWPT